VAHDVVVDGSLSADGENGQSTVSATRHVGGGAGGSIWLTAASVSGSGTISASGGSGSQSNATGARGGGGGGRIAIYTPLFAIMDSQVQATGSGSAGAQAGGAGTIVVGAVLGDGNLVIDNGGLNGDFANGRTELQGTVEVSSLTVRGRS